MKKIIFSLILLFSVCLLVNSVNALHIEEDNYLLDGARLYRISASHRKNMTIMNVELQGDGDYDGLGNYFRQCTNVRFINCTITNCGGTGLSLIGCKNVTIINCTITNNGYYGEGTSGIGLYESCENIYIAGNYIANNSGPGITGYLLQHSTIHNNTIIYNGKGLSFNPYGTPHHGSTNNNITFNTIEQNSIGVILREACYSNTFTNNNFILNPTQVSEVEPNIWQDNYWLNVTAPTPTPTEPSPTPSPTLSPTPTPTNTPTLEPAPNNEFSIPLEYVVIGITAITGVIVAVFLLRKK